MTRATYFVVIKSNLDNSGFTVYRTPEFNGYGNLNEYDTFIKNIVEQWNDVDSVDAFNSFCRNLLVDYRYEDASIIEENEFVLNTLEFTGENKSEFLTLTDESWKKYFHYSDYGYIKNLTGSDLEISTISGEKIVIKDKESEGYHFGEYFPRKLQDNDMKDKDTKQYDFPIISINAQLAELKTVKNIQEKYKETISILLEKIEAAIADCKFIIEINPCSNSVLSSSKLGKMSKDDLEALELYFNYFGYVFVYRYKGVNKYSVDYSITIHWKGITNAYMD